MNSLSRIALPMSQSPKRAQAKETLWRLLAAAMGHPTPELYDSLVDGRFHEAFGQAWQYLHDQPWPHANCLPTYTDYEASYIYAFLHGHKGRPVASLLAGEYDAVLAGLSRPVFMLNLGQFYKHFGLQAATADEGRQDEPDHLAVMAEFMAVLCHLEALALGRKRNPAPYRRAQRDFLARYLSPFIQRLSKRLNEKAAAKLDPSLALLLKEMATWSEQQIAELEAAVGVFRPLDQPAADFSAQTDTDNAVQNLWG